MVENNKLVKIIMVEKEVFNEDDLKLGQKVFYAFRDSYYEFDNWEKWGSRCSDSGRGKIVDIDEDSIGILYDGYNQNTYVEITIEDIRSGFHKVEILE